MNIPALCTSCALAYETYYTAKIVRKHGVNTPIVNMVIGSAYSKYETLKEIVSQSDNGGEMLDLLDWGSYADTAEFNAKKLVKDYKDNPAEVNAQIVEIAQNNNVPVA